MLLWINDCLMATGISLNYGIVHVKDLRIGMSYSMVQTSNYPLKAEYRGNLPADILIEPFIPQQQSLLPGYESIPDLSWIKLSNDRFAIGPPGGSVQSDVIIIVPNDEKYLGKNYQVMLKVTSSPRYKTDQGLGLGVAAALEGVLLLNIASKPPTPEEKEKIEKMMEKGNLGFELKPQYVYIEVEAGKKYEHKTDPLKIVNISDEKVQVDIKSIIPKDIGQKIPEGFEITKNPEFLRPKKDKINLKPDSVERIDFSVSIPKKDEYRNKKYVYVIEARSVGSLVSVSYISKLFITVK